MSLVKIKDKILDVVVAVTDVEQQKGLMNVEWPPPIMAFPGQLSVRKFWMHRTPSPLDIVFCRDNKIIHIAEGIPFSTNLVGPDEMVDLVVEFPKGHMKSINAKIGDSINVKYSRNDRKRILLASVDK